MGAVRHQGFIPWDDDIDIVMSRNDFDRLYELLKEDTSYRFLNYPKEDYYYTFGKIVDCRTVLSETGVQPIRGMGIYLDVFPLDGMPEGAEERDEYFGELEKRRFSVCSHALVKPKMRKNIVAYLKQYSQYRKSRKCSLLQAQQNYLEWVRKYSYENCDTVYASGGSYGKKDIFQKSFFRGSVILPFEDMQCSVPVEYEKYLKQVYGDYMTLPPMEKRVSHHAFTAYEKEKD